VPAQYIVAILGVETFYGRNTGRWRVVDALTTLAFDYGPRAQYFKGELEQYLLLAREQGKDAFAMRGSYAGAIGIPQFMPSSPRATRSTSTATARSTCAAARPTPSAAWRTS
jgi:membrane-bound lytic murein transglycosylase B